MDGQYSVMSWKYEPSIINDVAFCIYFLWTFELIVFCFFFPSDNSRKKIRPSACLGISEQEGKGNYVQSWTGDVLQHCICRFWFLVACSVFFPF